MATPEDRSLSSGISLPQWMKTKMNDRLDFEQSARSPTELDDTFILYYRNRGMSEPPKAVPKLVVSNPQVQKQDFSKHTPFCQKYLQSSNESNSAQLVQYPSATKTKSSGVDDGFKGEAAKCGSSVVRMAHQMVAGKMVRGFNDDECDGPPEGFNPSLRRGSKSLPASPLTSPKSTRRMNKYFTGAFVDNENHQGSWILSNLLSKRKTLSQSVGLIAEEEMSDIKKANSNASIDELGDAKKKVVFVAKPSELREMNFWSPTSM